MTTKTYASLISTTYCGNIHIKEPVNEPIVVQSSNTYIVSDCK